MRWLDRGLMFSPIYYGLCLDDKSFQKELKRLKINEPVRFIKNDHSDATVHFFETDNKVSAIVCLGKTKGKTSMQINALLLHEAVHIWQEIRLSIGEKSPSSEFEAYSIQAIAQNLMYAYDDMKKGKK